ncbi:preprotein translocase subunit SecG [Candidatus Babeliales bacterium]|nr:preprotein translocase subunit SecG [Candidatus Babeliales bacterium]
MTGFLMFLFVLLSLILVTFILIQQGKGDMGLGSLSRGSQMLFGGSGGQDFFEKATWIMGAMFMAGALGITILGTKELEQSRLQGYRAPLTQNAQQQQAPTQNKKPQS